MSKIRLTQEFTFEMAHALWNYHGSCRNVHGHSYKLYVTIIGNVSAELNSPKNGMVMDFTDISNLVKSLIINELDHCFVISSDADITGLKKINQMFEKLKFNQLVKIFLFLFLKKLSFIYPLILIFSH